MMKCGDEMGKYSDEAVIANSNLDTAIQYAMESKRILDTTQREIEESDRFAIRTKEAISTQSGRINELIKSINELKTKIVNKAKEIDGRIESERLATEEAELVKGKDDMNE